MRGDFFHNDVLLPPFISYFRLVGAEVFTEFHVRAARRWGFIDVVAMYLGRIVAIAAELGLSRVLSDIKKATWIEAERLYIVTPSRRLSTAVDRKIRLAKPSRCSELEVITLPFGAALSHVRQNYPATGDAESGLNVPEVSNSYIGRLSEPNSDLEAKCPRQRPA